ncbi:mechanosensitive ion channel family protein [Coraliomargarita akajimensis]|uniref:MscS Mechanosensitive ion channel n=1 Tax=Coraliomargarita akajimensis (strain DSM 45221 / IAM 15411 / JCM 23193 / KCTC 12865 / 04OKA010-24) TaxID=583355 RepID=D5EJC8_CORAD|nr:mechanosensitive ion channel family protein [Coraliomargarita akajimensis]ADE54527.1 MscS Mechanosensitive ion channel [Coraliomargarita akajimensis DSM 45221]
MVKALLSCLPLLLISLSLTAQPEVLFKQAESLRSEIDSAKSAYQQVTVRAQELEGEEREIIENQLYFIASNYASEIYELADVVESLPQDNTKTTELRAYIRPVLEEIPSVFHARLSKIQTESATLRAQLADASPEQQTVLQERIAVTESHIDKLFQSLFTHNDVLRQLGITSDQSEPLIEQLQERSMLTAGRLKRASEEHKLFRSLAGEHPDSADLKQQLAATEVARSSYLASLERQVALLEKNKVDVDYYQTLLVETSGDITRGFNLKVLQRLASQTYDDLKSWFEDSFSKLIGKFFIFTLTVIIFRYLGLLARSAVVKLMERPTVKLTVLLKKTIAKGTSNLVLFIGVLIALSQIGVSLGPVLAGIGVIGFIIGFALQDTLANFAAGMMILLYRPFDVDDYIESAGVAGKVNKMSLVSTTVLTLDNQTLIIPNNKVWGDVIRNVTHQRVRRVDLTVGVAYDSDIPHVERVLQGILDNYDKTLKSPEPIISVHELGDSSVNFAFRAWVRTDDYWEAYWYLTREVKIQLDKEGIGIPFPQRDVHHYYPEKPLDE